MRFLATASIRVAVALVAGVLTAEASPARGALPPAVRTPEQGATRCDYHAESLRDMALPLIRLQTSEPLPVGTGPCPGVRPGAPLITTDGGGCTFNFLFRGADRRKYIGTAGHCVLEDGEEKAWPPGTGPEVTNADGKRIGEFAYAVLDDPKDFALIRVDPGVKTSPQMCYFGGPEGINSEKTTSPVMLHWFGNGLGLGRDWFVTGENTLPARSAMAPSGVPDPDIATAYGPAIQGDSGSGVIDEDGRAIGVLVALSVGVDTRPGRGGNIVITRLEPQVKRAEEVLRMVLKLRTAKML